MTANGLVKPNKHQEKSACREYYDLQTASTTGY